MKKIIVFFGLMIFASVAAGLSFNDLFLNQERGDVALVDLSGTISPSSSGFSSSLTPEKVRDLNKMAEDRDVDAIVYEINSGGGAVVASKEIRRSIDNLEIPTVCRIRDVGASGAYLLSLGCDSIIADSASTTGSIGVTSSYIEFSDLMEELGVGYVNVTAGENKEVGSPYKEPTGEEKDILQEKTDIIGEEFLSDVSEARNLTQEQKQEVGTGEIFLGSEAEELGLVDELGGRETAIEKAENITGKNLDSEKLQQTPSFNVFDLFLSSLEIGSQSPIKASIN